MIKGEFFDIRKKLGKTQKQIASLLGVSLKAVHSYEQGWRTVPAHVERQLLFMVACKGEMEKKIKPCWVVKKCPVERKKQCPAWEFRIGKFCWFINGMVCGGQVQSNWNDKMQLCRSCEVLQGLL